MTGCPMHEPIGGPHFRKCSCGESFWVAGSYEYHRDKCPACQVKATFDQQLSAEARKKIAAELTELLRDYGIEDKRDAR